MRQSRTNDVTSGRTSVTGRSIARDVDGDILTLRITVGAAHGHVSLHADGSFEYLPDPNYNGSDSFTYQISDGLEVSEATVTLTVNSVNDPPSAADDSYTVTAGATLVGPAPGVLANDFDDSGHLAAVLVTGVSHGTLTLNSDGSFTYATSLTAAGTDSFTYKATDGTIDSAPATVTLTVVAASGGGGGASGTFGSFGNATLQVWDFDALNLHVGGTAGFKTKLGEVVARYGGLWYIPNAGSRGHDSFNVGSRRFEIDVLSDVWGD